MAHGNFDLYKRPSKSSNKVYYYYRAYNSNGVRLSGKSTGQTSKRAAQKYCEDLYKQGLLVPVSGVEFATYARDWYRWETCPYVADRIASGTKKKPGITKLYAQQLRGYLDNHILPYFGEYNITEINPVLIRSFRVSLQVDRVVSGVKFNALTNKSINNICSCLKIMTDWAIDSDVIIKDPFRGITQLLVDNDTRSAFTIDQVETILKDSWESYDAWLFTFVAACTGMRQSEVRGIRRESLHETYIDVDKQYFRANLSPLKTKDARKVPICSGLYKLLDEHTGNKRFTFDSGTGVPWGANALVEKFDKVVRSHFDKERDEKGLVFHSLRHFYNTYLQAENVPLNKVDAVIGHSGGKGTMTARYTDWSPEMFPEVYEANEKLFNVLI